MHTITRTFKWMLSAWPILIPAILIATHLFWIENSGAAPESVNKLISLILQVVGGLIVLYSIDLNIGVIQKSGLFAMLTAWFKAFPLIKAQPELVWCLTPSTGINVVNKINLLRKPLLRYQYFNNGIKSKKMAFFDFGVTTCKTTKKWQKEGRFTTPVPVDP